MRVEQNDVSNERVYFARVIATAAEFLACVHALTLFLLRGAPLMIFRSLTAGASNASDMANEAKNAITAYPA